MSNFSKGKNIKELCGDVLRCTSHK